MRGIVTMWKYTKMYKRNLLTSMLSLILSLLLISCAQKNLILKKDIAVKDMVIFDKNYIPALVFTNEQRREASKTAINSLKVSWEIFKSSYSNYSLEDRDWKRDFDSIEQMIAKADEIINGGNNLLDAHESLERIRFIFMELRKRNNVDYYIDYLTEFHKPMESIVLTVEGKAPDTLTDAEIYRIKSFLLKAMDIWEKVKGADFNSEIYDFNDQKMAEMRDYIKSETKTLSELKQAIEAEDKGSIIFTSLRIKPYFVKLFTLFGDFESIE